MSQQIIVYGPDQIIRYVILWDGSVPIEVGPDEGFAQYSGPAGVGWKWTGDVAIAPAQDVAKGLCVPSGISYGSIKGTVYEFREVGDVLPIHTHTEKDVHISIVARGSFMCHGDRGDMTISAGEVIDWEPGEHHGFKALEANSRLVNIIKG